MPTSLSTAPVVVPAGPAQLSATLVERIETVRAMLPAKPTACRYGNTFCVSGDTEHDPCSTGWLKATLAGEKNPVAILEIAIEHYSEDDPPLLVLCADGHDAVELNAAQAREAVASVLDHLPRMITMIDQYDALLGGAA